MFFVLRDVWLFWSLNVVAFLYIFVFFYLFEPVFVVELSGNDVPLFSLCIILSQRPYFTVKNLYQALDF